MVNIYCFDWLTPVGIIGRYLLTMFLASPVTRDLGLYNS
jgi:hypothetical protein